MLNNHPIRKRKIRKALQLKGGGGVDKQFRRRTSSLRPNPNRDPAYAVAIWKGGARERADDAFLCVSIKKRRSKADFAPTW